MQPTSLTPTGAPRVEESKSDPAIKESACKQWRHALEYWLGKTEDWKRISI